MRLFLLIKAIEACTKGLLSSFWV